MFVKNKYYSTDEFSKSLEESGGLKVNDFFKAPIGKMIASEPGQHVRFLQLPYKGKQTGFYLKQNLIRPKSIRRFFLKRIVTILPTTREAKMTKILAGHKAPVANIVLWGEQLLFGKLPIRGFMISEEIVGDEAVTLFQKGDKKLRRRILCEVGRLMAKRVEMGCYYAPRMRDFICTHDDGNALKLSMIDQEVRVPELREFSEAASYECISDAYWKMIANELPLDVMEFRVFINGFVEGLSGDWRPLKSEALHGALMGTYSLMSRVKQTVEQVAESDFEDIMNKRNKLK